MARPLARSQSFVRENPMNRVPFGELTKPARNEPTDQLTQNPERPPRGSRVHGQGWQGSGERRPRAQQTRRARVERLPEPSWRVGADAEGNLVTSPTAMSRDTFPRAVRRSGPTRMARGCTSRATRPATTSGTNLSTFGDFRTRVLKLGPEAGHDAYRSYAGVGSAGREQSVYEVLAVAGTGTCSTQWKRNTPSGRSKTMASGHKGIGDFPMITEQEAVERAWELVRRESLRVRGMRSVHTDRTGVSARLGVTG